MKTEKEITIELDYPVQLGDRELKEIVMRRPTMQEQIDFPPKQGDFKVEMKLYARLTGLTYEDMLLLDMGDYTKLQKQFGTFLKDEDEPTGN